MPLHLKDNIFFLDLSLTVTEINNQNKVQKQEKKHYKCKKIGMLNSKQTW